MSDHSSGAEQGALPPADGGPSTPTRVPTVVGVERSPMQIAQVIGGQYIITSQSQAGVPPLTQIVSNPPVSPINSRIINIASISRTPNLSNQSIVNALTKPRTSNVRAQLFPSSGDPSEAGSSHVSSSGISRISPGSSPARKRSRADELPPGCENLSGSRARAMEHKWARSKCIKESYYEHIAELYFLETSGNMLDYYAWRKKPRTSHYTSYLLKHQLDASDLSQEETPSQPQISHQTHQQQMQVARLTSPKLEAPVAVTQSTSAVSTIGTGTLLAAPITQPGILSPKLEGTRFLLLKPTITVATKTIALVTTTTTTTTTENTVKVPEVSNLMPIVSVHSPSVTTTTAVSTAIVTSIAASKPTPTTAVNTVTKTKSIVSSLSGGNQEQIVEKAKQEAYVMQRVSELQKEGLWTERRLPKVQETTRCKSHWDYLLEEMVWLAADFAQERKWKKAAAKKCARMVQKYFQDKALAAQKAEKAQELQLRRIASFIAKEIKTFWSNVEKLVEFKQQTRLEEKRKKALDQHLSFIVDQTEKYSQLLAKDMNKSLPEPQSTSINSSRVPSPHSDDDEFRPVDNSSDDEETIAQAEAADEKEEQSEEVAALQRESEMNLEDFLNELPENYLEMRDKIKLSESEEEEEEEDNEKSSSKTEVSETKKKASKDDEFTVDSEEESEDDEDTIMEQEEKEGEVDHKQELDELQAENDMSIEELMKKYSGPPPTDEDKMSVDEEPEEESEESTEEEEEEEQSEEEESEEEEKGSDEEVGLKSLLEDETNSGEKNKTEGDDDHLINDVAAIAESIQPKGNTLSSTNVVTPVPFLLKHSLREYQHIGLDWLVTMFERKLNGILADEMGLGKTIQTIALLAHLACVKGDWGPHLIIVPTSVMLNWEMECKKWCPGFKILTYYGTQKERKLKRTGWTKPNAFHICITSYKLVIQDHQSFRRKKWKYLILDEAQNIKNFKSQRWQLLLNFQTQQRLLLTGTPLQNNLMELWSLMHFLMPNVFQSHREFREWFSNPVTGMIEGNSEYNESIIKRLHKVLRPFLLRRLKSEVEKQMPKKFEHIVMCRLSKRQRFLYDDYMSRAKTKETLASGNLLSVINVLMQLRKVCNHPNLFEVRPTVSPFKMEGIVYNIPSLVYSLLDTELFERVDFNTLHLQLMNLELTLTAYGAYRTCKYRAPGKLIECIDSAPEPPPKCPPGLVRMRVKMGEPSKVVSPGRLGALVKPASPGKSGSSQVKVTGSPVQQGLKLRVTGPTGAPLQGYSVQLVQHHGSVKAIPVATLSSGQAAAVTNPPLALKPMGGAIKTEQRVSVGGFAQLVQTPMGKHILLTQSAALPAASTVAIGTTTTVMTSSGQRLTVLSKPVTNVTTSITTSPVKTIMNSTPAVSTTTSVVFSTHSDTITTTTATSDATTNSVDSNVPISITRPLTASLVQQLKSNAPPTSNTAGSTKKRSPSVDEKKEEPEKIDPLKVSYNERVQQCREHKLAIILRFNEWRCQASPMYGGDLRESLTMRERATSYNQWTGAYLTLQQAASKYKQWQHGKSIQELVHTPTDYVNELMDLFHRYVFCVPAVFAPAPTYRVLNPPQAKYWTEQRDVYKLQQELSPMAAVLHPIASAMVTQFPDPRLIQYDCGKLQTLDLLLRKLKAEGHRVLIFTQMTRMLDVLEAFLNFHGHIYLRLDGTTKVDQRQVLMERFNGDKRIFAFILSTRSGGVGVNLTGADTVIFYDSDWNPTMDAQAQDRCHRIGQTRDVHIYRLVSEKTIEENILKKANQKRMLGDLAIEGGNFTTAYFKSSTIQDLFNVDASEEDASARMDLPKARPAESVASAPATNEDRAALGALESALAACEDDQDVQAARTAKAEAVADLAEFDESIPLEEGAEKEEMSKAEIEVQNLIKQLTPVERYAMRFVEETEAAWSAEQLAAAEREIEEQKREWEENRLAALRKEEERRKGNLEEEAELLTFSREDSTNQVRSKSSRKRRGRPRGIAHNKRDSIRLLDDEPLSIRQRRSKSRIREDSKRVKSDSEEELKMPGRKSKRNSVKTDDESESSDMFKDEKIGRGRKRTRLKSVSQIEDEKFENDKINKIEVKVVKRRGRKKAIITEEAEETVQKCDEVEKEIKNVENETVIVENCTETNVEVKETEPEVKEVEDNLQDDCKTDDNIEEISEKHDAEVDENKEPEKPWIVNKINNLITDGIEKIQINASKNNKLPESDSDLSGKAPLLNNHINNSEKSESESSESDGESDYTEDSDDRPLKSPQVIANKVDADSPRTRSHGTVKINLWTLDVSPILPGVKPIIRSNTPLPRVKKQRIIRSDNGKIKNFKPHFDKERDGNITVCPENPKEKCLIQKCINNEVAVVVTDIATTDTCSLVTSPNSTNTDTFLTSSPKKDIKKFRKPRILKLKKSQKQTLDQWLNQTDPEIKRRKNSESDSEPSKKLTKVDSNEINKNKVNSEETPMLNEIDAELIVQMESKVPSPPKKVNKIRKRCESDSESIKKSRELTKLRKNSVSDSETNKLNSVSEDESEDEPNKIIMKTLMNSKGVNVKKKRKNRSKMKDAEKSEKSDSENTDDGMKTSQTSTPVDEDVEKATKTTVKLGRIDALKKKSGLESNSNNINDLENNSEALPNIKISQNQTENDLKSEIKTNNFEIKKNTRNTKVQNMDKKLKLLKVDKVDSTNGSVT